MNWHSLLLQTASHLFVKSVSCRSAKFTTGNFECIVCLKRFSLQKFECFTSKPSAHRTFLNMHIKFNLKVNISETNRSIELKCCIISFYGVE